MSNSKETLHAVSKQEYLSLKDCTHMLGMVGTAVEDFFENKEHTTLQAVLNLLQKYHEAKAEIYRLEKGKQ